MNSFYAKLQRIDGAVDQRLRLAGVGRERVDALCINGGSAGLLPLAQRIAACFTAAKVLRGDRFTSVAQGLGVHAPRVFGA